VQPANPVKILRIAKEILGTSETEETYLNTRDTNANVGRLYHADIVCTISNSEKKRLVVFLN
jgi:hypothetical protein